MRPEEACTTLDVGNFGREEIDDELRINETSSVKIKAHIVA
jgi:hypothetical protein